MKLFPIHPACSSMNLGDQALSPDLLKQRLKLEGQCKIQQIEVLELSYIKTAFFFVPVIISIIGIFLIKYYMSIRVKLFFYQSNLADATHIYVRGLTRSDSEIVKIAYKGQRIFFFYRKLKYELIDNMAYPVGANPNQLLKNYLSTDYLKTGLNDQIVQNHKYNFGLNQHIIDPPTYYEYLYEVLTEPFFFIQYLAATIYIIVRLPQLSYLLLGSSLLTTSINYLLLYISYRRIKQISQTSIIVEVIRNRQLILLPSNQIVPGDLFVPLEQMCCDAIILKGEVYVNQSNLTGESVPIGKFGLNQHQIQVENDNSKWIYEGSKILSSVNPLAMAIHTGYTTKRGQILRKILNRPVLISELFKSCLYFLLCTYIIGATLYLTTMSFRIQNGTLQGTVIFLNFLLIVTQCFPPGCPIYFNLVYSFCLMRLKSDNILGTQPQKTIESAHLKVMCFDKTGTLTQETVEIVNIYKFDQKAYKQIKDSSQEERLDFKLFGSCHTVQCIKGELLGDQIDLKMFKNSPYLIKSIKTQNIFFEVQTQEGHKFNNIKILKIFQYESKFQSMSVLVYDKETESHYVFVKGAPELIHENSVKKYDYFTNLLQMVSYRGFRCIAYGYKKLNRNEVQIYLQGNRNLFMKNIDILGFLVFQNKLKMDANQTIELLRTANIESKIITGDNIYIAIETSIRCGILNRNQQISIIEGYCQNSFQSQSISQRKIHVKKIVFNSEELYFQTIIISYQQFITYPSSLVIDNDFLNKLSKNKLVLSENIKVFCRISPQNKALIIRMFKQNIKVNNKKLTRMQRMFTPLGKKIGMIGDGSNDLLAIRQADIGIGIKNCDSSYAASFSVETLKHIDNIVREAKCAERQIIQIIRFISITSFMSVPLIIMTETEGAYFSSFQLIIGNITKYLVINIFLALSRPLSTISKYNCCSNFMKLQNQLVYWGNVILGSLGHLTIMIYYRTQSQYQWNFKQATTSSGWTSLTSIISSQYLFYSVHPIALAVGIYVSSPWKEPIYKNYILFATIIINITIFVLLFAIFPELQNFLGFVHISSKSLGYIALICAVCSILVLLYNAKINSLNLHQKQANEGGDNALLSQP